MPMPRSSAPPERPSSISAQGSLVGGDGCAPVAWEIAEETPVALACNGRQRLVMMATPADLEDFAVGMALTEGIVARVRDIEAIAIEAAEDGIVVDLMVDPARLAGARLRRRAIEGRSGCGICGVEALDDLPGMHRRSGRPRPAGAEAMLRGLRELARHQPGNARCRSLHAAAWCDRDGKVLLAREDVGRHNALDKLLGALARRGEAGDGVEGFVVMSSRCSFELVQKAATFGIAALVTVSAPTALALRVAGAAGMTLAARAGDAVVVFDPSCLEAAA